MAAKMDKNHQLTVAKMVVKEAKDSKEVKEVHLEEIKQSNKVVHLEVIKKVNKVVHLEVIKKVNKEEIRKVSKVLTKKEDKVVNKEDNNKVALQPNPHYLTVSAKKYFQSIGKWNQMPTIQLGPVVTSLKLI